MEHAVLEKSRLRMIAKLSKLERTPEAVELLDDLMTQKLTMTLLAKAIVYEGNRDTAPPPKLVTVVGRSRTGTSVKTGVKAKK